MSFTQITRILLVVIGTMTILAFVSACAPFDGRVTINEMPAPPPTPIVMPTQPSAAAPVIIVQPAPVVMQPAPTPTPAPDYTPALLVVTLALMVVLVGVAVAVTRRPQTTGQAQAQPPPAQLPSPSVTHVTNHYHLHFGNMTRGDKLAWLVRDGYTLEQAKEMLDQGVGLSQLPAPRGGSER